jgi:GDP-4-dehydro-6-deoxy-D-mannose reductase
MPTKVLITGITGFVGSHLADHLLAQGGYEVWGTCRWRSRRENIEHLCDKVNLVETELNDMTNVLDVLESVAPDQIYHLAAQSFVPSSWRSPANTISTNIIANVNIYEAIRRLHLSPRMMVACSSEEYGLVLPNEVPIKEENPLRPLSPYAVSKVGQDFLAYQYFKSYGIQVVRTRAFNHTGPRRGDVFVTSNFSRQIARIEAGKQEPIIQVGNLNAIRDFTDVRDIVRGYRMAVELGDPGDIYNLASGKGIKIQDMLDILVGKSKVKIEIRVDSDRLRPSDVEILIGDATKFRQKTGWEPHIPLEQTLSDLLEYWRLHV